MLSKKWNEIDDNSNTIFPLFETFEAVVQALGPVIQPYAMDIYMRCCRILANYVVKSKADNDSVYTLSNFMIRSMDLLTSLFSALKEQAQALLVQSDLLNSLCELVLFRDNTVKQYVFGLMGDMVKCMGELLNQALPTFIGVAVDQLYYDDNLPTTLTVCNNSAWFIG